MSEAVPSGSPFDALRHEDERGEYWLARELMKPLGYARWQRFADAIERARVALRANGEDPDRHVTGAEHLLKSGQTVPEYRLTRYGVYATIQGADPRKPEIAAGWAYFRIRTRQAELAELTPRTYLEALEAAAATERARLALAAAVRELAPKAATYDAIVADESWYTASEVAKSHFQHLRLGRNGLEQAIEGKFIFRDPCDGTRHPRRFCAKGHWSPYQQYIERGLFCVKWRAGAGGASGYEFPGLFFSIKGIEAVCEYLNRETGGAAP